MESRGDSPRSWRDLRASAVVFGGARKNPFPSGYRGEHHRVHSPSNFKSFQVRFESAAWVACEWPHFPKSQAVIVIIRMRDAPSNAVIASEMRHTKKVFVPLRTVSWLIFVFPLLLLQCSLGEWVNLFSKFRFTGFTSENGVVQFKTQFPVLLLCRTAKGSRLYSNRLHAFWYQRSPLFWGFTAEKY